MILQLNELFRAHPWVPTYGPILVVTVLSYLFKVVTRLIREHRWIWLDRSYFYFGMALLWASFGRVASFFIGDIYGGSVGYVYLEFFAGWALCALFIFAIHAAYDVPEADLLNRLVSIWEHDKRHAEQLGRGFDDPKPTHKNSTALQRRDLAGVASTIGLATFALFDYLFVRALLPPF